MRLNTDLFIRRPVLATVISLFILMIGLSAMLILPLRQFPKMENTVISIMTAYPGADAELIQGYITSPIQRAIASAEGVDYITSVSMQDTSMVQAHIKANFSSDKAFASVASKVAAVKGELPKESKEPTLLKEAGQSMAQMYIGFDSKTLSQLQISEYLNRVVRPKLETIDGVAKAEIMGSNRYAMRIWLNAKRMAALGVSPGTVMQRIQAMNIQTAAGQTKGEFTAYNIKAKTDLQTPVDFENLIIKQNGSALVRLRDVASVELGATSYNSSVIFNGKRAVFMAIFTGPQSNPLTVIKTVKTTLQQVKTNLPKSLQGQVVYDATDYIRHSIIEVIRTIFEATCIVVVIIFLFLGSVRSVFIPVLTIPLSLIGVCAAMYLLDYSINLLTLLAMVLAIGLVVDDAIVVVENIHRHIESGLSPIDAAIKGAREIALPVIAMTVTLAVVYAPIGFTSGLTGALFREFAFTLAGCVIISGVIALTLSPMLCSKLLKKAETQAGFHRKIELFFQRVQSAYQRRLQRASYDGPVTGLFIIVLAVSSAFMFIGSNQELAPAEDQSILFIAGSGPIDANINYMMKYADQLASQLTKIPELQSYFSIIGWNGSTDIVAGALLKSWSLRSKSQQQLMPVLQSIVGDITGLSLMVWPLPALPGVDGAPIQFVLTSTEDFKTMSQIAAKLKAAAMKSGYFLFVDDDLKFNKPLVQININRLKAAEIGISMQDISSSLGAALGGGDISRFAMQGQSYPVITQVRQQDRMQPKDIANLYVKTAAGKMVPLSTIVTLSMKVTPNALHQMQQLNAVTVMGVLVPGKSMGQALEYLRTKTHEIAAQVTVDYLGPSRQFYQEGYRFIYAMVLALMMIYLVLAAQFESFRDPFIILLAVPLSMCGALLPIYFGIGSVNIYTKIGIITLIGLISKHGILMVDFANHLQKDQKLSTRNAIIQAASIRLRPILMTTAAMVFGVIPLLFASGAGSGSRFALGLVIASGMSVGTLFTLFVIPAMYIALAKNHNPTVA